MLHAGMKERNDERIKEEYIITACSRHHNKINKFTNLDERKIGSAILIIETTVSARTLEAVPNSSSTPVWLCQGDITLLADI